MIPSFRARPSLPLASLLATFVLAGCAVAHDPGTGTEGETQVTSAALLKCGPNQTRECSNEGPGGSMVCWCNDNPPPPPPPPPPIDHCTPDATNPGPPPGLPGCQPGFWVNQAEFFLCPSTTAIPDHIYVTGGRYHQVSEWIYTTNTTIQPRCSSYDGGPAGDSCYYSQQNIPHSCLPVPPAGYVYLVEWGDPGGPIGGGAHGPQELAGP